MCSSDLGGRRRGADPPGGDAGGLFRDFNLVRTTAWDTVSQAVSLAKSKSPAKPRVCFKTGGMPD